MKTVPRPRALDTSILPCEPLRCGRRSAAPIPSRGLLGGEKRLEILGKTGVDADPGIGHRNRHMIRVFELAPTVKVPPFGIASTAFKQRFNSPCSSCCASTWIEDQSIINVHHRFDIVFRRIGLRQIDSLTNDLFDIGEGELGRLQPANSNNSCASRSQRLASSMMIST